MGSSIILALGTVGAAPAASQTLLAQQIVDGLPPPPSAMFGQESLPPSVQAPALSPSLPPSSVAPSIVPSPTAAPSVQRYLVVVNGDSPLLLSQVQTIVADASLQDYNGQRFIQAGLFDSPTIAQQQVNALAAQGIGAEIVALGDPSQPAPPASTVASSAPSPELLPVPVPREVEFGQPTSTAPGSFSDPASPEVEAAAPSDANAFYVVIPGRESELTAITNQVLRLGDGYGITQLVQTGEQPRGPHVRVGPFSDRGAAFRWTRYFRDFGMDARVYYDR